MLSLIAPAKLNLFLHITGKRPDGYHFLESLVAFSQFGDRLTFAPAQEISVSIHGPFASTLGDNNNLVLVAAQRLREIFRISQGAAILLEKNIPVGAGLGGGSSDAALALRGLAQLWNIPVQHAALLNLAPKLGSDVPVCLYGKTALMQGIGERITPLPLTLPLAILLVNPAQPLLTADVFRKFKGEFSAPLPTLHPLDSREKLLSLLTATRNDLEAPAIAAMPVIRSILDTLAAQTGCELARMSGSGATCFGVFSTTTEAQQAETTIKKAYPNWWTQTTMLQPQI